MVFENTSSIPVCVPQCKIERWFYDKYRDVNSTIDDIDNTVDLRAKYDVFS